MASQDSWALPLANELVGVFRVASLSYIRTATAYDPATGDVVSTDTTYNAAGAVTKMTNDETSGAGGPQILECWVNLEGIGDIWPTLSDALFYDGRRWNITSVAPMYSGDKKYAAKLTGRSS